MNIRKPVWSNAIILSLISASQLPLFAQGSLTPSAAPAPMFKSLDQIESRTPISVSTTISAPGAYYLTGNIAVSSGNGITISANGVNLDLKGFTISSTANPASGIGIALAGGVTNIVIRDGFIYSPIVYGGTTNYSGAGFDSGIYYTGTQPFNVRVSDVSVSGCLSNGIYLNSTVGNATANSVDGCLVTDCGVYGIVAEKITDSSATVGTGVGIFCSTGSRNQGTSYSNAGLDAVLNGQDCFGQSTMFYGINAATMANNCFGASSTAYGISSMGANNCYGITSTGTAGLYAGSVANNCYGMHSGSGGGEGLFASELAHGCVGINSSSGIGFGILSGNVMSGCVGSGFTNSQAVVRYNTP